MLAARRGDTDRALTQLAEARSQPVDGWHQSVLDATWPMSTLRSGAGSEAAVAAEHGWESTCTTSALWAARFAMLGVAATVERRSTSARVASPSTSPHTIAHLQERIDAARSFAGRCPHGGTA